MKFTHQTRNPRIRSTGVWRDIHILCTVATAAGIWRDIPVASCSPPAAAATGRDVRIACDTIAVRICVLLQPAACVVAMHRVVHWGFKLQRRHDLLTPQCVLTCVEAQASIEMHGIGLPIQKSKPGKLTGGVLFTRTICTLVA